MALNKVNIYPRRILPPSGPIAQVFSFDQRFRGKNEDHKLAEIVS